MEAEEEGGIVRAGGGSFENRMTPVQTALGWCYFPLHFILLPVLLRLYAAVSGTLDGAGINLIYYGAGTAFLLFVMLPWLRDSFDLLLDRPGSCVRGIVTAAALSFGCSLLMGLLLMALGDVDPNPNDTEIMAQASRDNGVIMSLAIFIGPLIEETLFRGVVFGSLRRRSRVLAYLVSLFLFCLYHVWQYAVYNGDITMLLYGLEYIPIGLVITWCYESTECIWTTIFFHMANNALTFFILQGAG